MVGKNSEQLEQKLSRRERQIMDALFELSQATAHEILAAIPEPPSYSAVRAMVSKLVDKGLVQFRREGTRYIYSPVGADDARRSAMDRLVKTFFGGSTAQATAALLGSKAEQLPREELDQLAHIIENAQQKLDDESRS